MARGHQANTKTLQSPAHAMTAINQCPRHPFHSKPFCQPRPCQPFPAVESDALHRIRTDGSLPLRHKSCPSPLQDADSLNNAIVVTVLKLSRAHKTTRTNYCLVMYPFRLPHVGPQPRTAATHRFKLAKMTRARHHPRLWRARKVSLKRRSPRPWPRL